MTIHHYTGTVHDASYTLGARDRPRELLGSGDSPSDAWLNRVDWYRVAERPDPPSPTGYRWAAGDPEYALVGVVSTPQGAWEAIDMATRIAAAIEASRERCTEHILAGWDARPERARDKRDGVDAGVYGQGAKSYKPTWINANLTVHNAEQAAIEAAADQDAIDAIVAATVWPEYEEPV